MTWQQIVTPVNDIRPHIDSEHCHCQPRIADGVLTHNAFDGRDRAERYDEAMGTQGQFASIVDCVQIGRIILEQDDGAPLTFVSSLTTIGDRFRFEVGNSDCRYRVTIKIEEI